jgi:hypothetical protein
MRIVQFLFVTILLVIGSYGASCGFIASKALEKTNRPVDKKSTPNQTTPTPGIDYDGLNFRDEESLDQYLREQSWNRWCAWVFSLPREILPLFAAMAFGFCGGAIRSLFQLMRPPRQDLTSIAIIAAPLFGAAIGFLLFMMALLLPKMIVSGNQPIKPETLTLAALSLFGGVFSDESYNWINSQIAKFFPKNQP